MFCYVNLSAKGIKVYMPKSVYKNKQNNIIAVYI